jgi:uncharacterized protein YpiB (UPF0302 family)
METVSISGRIKKQKEVEFFHTTESLKSSLKRFCDKLEIKINSKNQIEIFIGFAGKQQMENYYSRNEFDILLGTVKSLCYDIEIKIGNELVS